MFKLQKCTLGKITGKELKLESIWTSSQNGDSYDKPIFKEI